MARAIARARTSSCVRMYVCAHARTHTRTHACTHVHTYTREHANLHTYIYMYIYIHTPRPIKVLVFTPIFHDSSLKVPPYMNAFRPPFWSAGRPVRFGQLGVSCKRHSTLELTYLIFIFCMCRYTHKIHTHSCTHILVHTHS